MKKLLLSGGLLALSGALSGIVFLANLNVDDSTSTGATNPILAYLVPYSPGALFGVVTAALLFRQMRLKWWGVALWVGASMAAWRLALIVNFQLMDSNLSWTTVPAGITGAALLAVGCWALVRGRSWRQLAAAVVLGGLLGGVMWIILFGDATEGDTITGYPYFGAAFAIWQAGVGLALVWQPVKLLNKSR